MENLLLNDGFEYKIYDKYICEQNIDRIKYYSNKEKNINALSAGYHLNKETQQKTGGIFFFNISEDNKLTLLNDENIFLDYGVLDIKIINNNSFITANSDYSYSIIDIKNSKNNQIIKHSLSSDEKFFNITNDILEITKDNSKIFSGTNDGKIYIDDLNKINNLKKIDKAHDYGIWSLHLLQNNENILLSGAEDAKIKIWDLRCDNKNNIEMIQKGVSKDTYNSSINYIEELKFDLSGNILITGSYDEKIILFDIRKFPTELKSIKTEHSSWDMKQLKIKNDNLIFISSIYEGFNIWNIDLENNYNMKHLLRLPVTKNEDIFHKTIVYGLDVKINQKNTAEILSCSFYDNLVMFWKFNTV